jgi:hypothetical protein
MLDAPFQSGLVAPFGTGEMRAYLRRTRSAGGGGFTPTDIAGMTLWLRADVAAYNDAGSTLATDAQTVRQWNDQSASARNASQATSGNRPTWRSNSGLPYVEFADDGVTKNLSCSGSSLLPSRRFTFCARLNLTLSGAVADEAVRHPRRPPVPDQERPVHDPVPFLDADGDPTDPTTPDTEFSLDAGAFADCAEEVTTVSRVERVTGTSP